MISKDQSIALQVAAKVAADLTPKNGDALAILADWAIIFDGVKDALLDAHATDNVIQAFPGTVVEAAAPAPTPAAAAAPSAEWTVELANESHGPIPSWLIAACRKAGVRKVFDNRDQLAEHPTRPWFRQADAQQGAKVQAFWPPKGVAA